MMCFSCRVTSDAKVVFLDVIPTPQDIISDFHYICLLLTIKFEYMENISRRTAIKTFLAGGVALATTGIEAAAAAKKKTDVKEPLKGNVRHSVSKWCFGDYKLDEFCEICKHIGIESVELLDPVDWPIVQKHGLTVAMAQGAGLGIDRGFNDPALHDELVASYEKVIPMVADAGLTNLICFSGRRNGVTDLQGWENCEKGLKRLIPLAEKHKVVLTMELLNSVGHKDYLCDHTVWGAELCRRIGSPNFKLLYDIYHMQIMEGNIIENIRKYNQYFSHVHTGGSPGRAEIDETQELYYPAIIKALMETGYKGFVGQEFVPAQEDKIASLEKCIRISNNLQCQAGAVIVARLCHQRGFVVPSLWHHRAIAVALSCHKGGTTIILE